MKHLIKLLPYTLLLLQIVPPLAAPQSPPCCNGSENYIFEKHCPHSPYITNLNCSKKYLLENIEANDISFHNEVLHIAGNQIKSDEYCQTSLDNVSVYLVCFPDESKYEEIRFTIYAIFELISVVFILLTIAIYLITGLTDDLGDKCVLIAIFGMACSFTVLAINQLNTKFIESNFCIGIALSVYFTMIFAFFWLNLYSFHLWRTTVDPFFLRKYTKWWCYYCVFGVTIPICLVTLLYTYHRLGENNSVHPGLGQSKCWFKTIESEFVFLYAPIVVLLLMNVFFYIHTIMYIGKINLPHSNSQNRTKYKVWLAVKLFSIMGLNWTFEVISAAMPESTAWFWFITDCVNTLQGVIIFTVLVVYRKKVLRALAQRKICGSRLPSKWRDCYDDEIGNDLQETTIIDNNQ